MISFHDNFLNDYSESSSKEWLLSNGLGGYSSSTIVGANTRKYHGLLIASFNPPWERKLLLSKLEEEVILGGDSFNISTNQYPDSIHPKGYRHLKWFRLDPHPKFIYSLPDFSIEKTICVPHETNSVLLNYRISNETDKSCKIRVRPLVNYRDIDRVSNFEENEFFQEHEEKRVKMFESSKDNHFLSIGSDQAHYRESGLSEEERWYRNMEYEVERKRGFSFREDHYNPGYFELKIDSGENIFNILASGGYGVERDFDRLYSENPRDYKKMIQKSKERFEELRSPFREKNDKEVEENLEYLLNSADSFIVEDRMLLAGYHWFTAWGRDSLIALPGLTMVQGRDEIAKNVLLTLADNQQEGFIPNRITGGESELNSADASLLFFHTLYKYLTYTNDLDIVDELWDVLNKILTTYAGGETEKVRMGSDNLIWTSGGLTWMDARVDGNCVTPREGKTVEINALWYNALKIMELISRKTGKKVDVGVDSKKVKNSFQERFWDHERKCLRDLVDGPNSDKLRPNQIFALSLPFPLFEGKKAENILVSVREKLLTPYGLRSLEVEDEDYIGRYEGDIRSKDRAYHQGTVWSWLIGPYVSAVSEFGGGNEDLENIIENLINSHIFEAGLGTVSEIFDGDEPHYPRGCISQAWSVGEILRCYVEDILEKEPPFKNMYRGDDS